MARILAYTPTYNDMMLPETAASVRAQVFDGVIDYEIDDRDLHAGRSMLEVCEKYRDARQHALDGGYDALLTVEHDMILPPDCVQKLWSTPAPVVYAAYMLRHGPKVVNMFRVEGYKSPGMSYTLFPREMKKAKKQAAIEVSGGGFGCTLMRREALEKCPFRMLEDGPPDMAFAGDCLRAGVLQMGRWDAACLHVAAETGERLSVDELGSGTVRVLALQDVTVSDASGAVTMKKDRYYSLSLSFAMEHERAGYVRVTTELAEEVDLAELADDAAQLAADTAKLADAEGAVETAVADEYDTAEAPVQKVRPRSKAPARKRKPAVKDA